MTNHVLTDVCLSLLMLVAMPVVAQDITLITESYHIPSGDEGIELYVRNKRPQRLTDFTAAKTLLFVHGATYPAETTFDLQLEGYSWMDFIAQKGYDVYLMDLRGVWSLQQARCDEPAGRRECACCLHG